MESMIDLKALLVEREDCDAGTVQQLRNALAQGGPQYRSLRDVADNIKKKLESASGAAAKRWHLKLGIAQFFLGHMGEAAENLRQAEGALAGFYLGRALASRQEYDDALKAYERAEKAGYTASQVNLQRAGIYRLRFALGGPAYIALRSDRLGGPRLQTWGTRRGTAPGVRQTLVQGTYLRVPHLQRRQATP